MLDADERHRRRVMLTGERGVQFLLLRGLGAQLSTIEAPFDTEPGAYGQEHPHGHHHVDKG